MKQRNKWKRTHVQKKQDKAYLMIAMLFALFILTFSLEGDLGLTSPTPSSSGQGSSFFSNQLTGNAIVIGDITFTDMHLIAFGAIGALIIIITLIYHFLHKRREENKLINENLPEPQNFENKPSKKSHLKSWRNRKSISLEDEMNEVNSELQRLRGDQILLEKPKVILRVNRRSRGYSSEPEEKTLQYEAENIQNELTLAEQKPDSILRHMWPNAWSHKKSQEEIELIDEVRRITRKVEGNNPLPENELITIERELQQLRRKLNK